MRSNICFGRKLNISSQKQPYQIVNGVNILMQYSPCSLSLSYLQGPLPAVSLYIYSIYME